MAKFKVKRIDNSGRQEEMKTYVAQMNKLDSKKDIVILEELREFIPPLSVEEIVQLEENILEEGIRDPLVFWERDKDLVLIDGHNRYGIAQKHKLDFKREFIVFTNIEEAKDWMLRLQLGRRNLTPTQLSYLRGLQYLRDKSKAGGQVGNDNATKNDGVKLTPSFSRTRERLADEHGVTYRTIERDALYARGIEMIAERYPDWKREVLAGKVKANKAKVQEVAKSEDVEVAIERVIAKHKPNASTNNKDQVDKLLNRLQKAFEDLPMSDKVDLAEKHKETLRAILDYV